MSCTWKPHVCDPLYVCGAQRSLKRRSRSLELVTSGLIWSFVVLIRPHFPLSPTPHLAFQGPQYLHAIVSVSTVSQSSLHLFENSSGVCHSRVVTLIATAVAAGTASIHYGDALVVGLEGRVVRTVAAQVAHQAFAALIQLLARADARHHGPSIGGIVRNDFGNVAALVADLIRARPRLHAAALRVLCAEGGRVARVPRPAFAVSADARPTRQPTIRTTNFVVAV